MPPTQKNKLLVIGLGWVAVTVGLLGSRFYGSGGRHGAAGPEPASTLWGHRMPVQALAFGPDGTSLTSVAYFLGAPLSGAEVGVWDLGGDRPAIKSRDHLNIRPFPAPALAPGGRRLAYTSGRTIWLWDAAYPDERRLLAEHPTPVTDLAFAADGCRLAVADSPGDLTLLDAADGRLLAHSEGRAANILGLTFAPEGTLLASGMYDRTVRLWDAVTGEERAVLRGTARFLVPLSVSFSPDGRTLATGDMGGNLKLWDTATGQEQATLTTYDEEIPALVFAPDGRTLAVAVGRTAQLWDVQTRKPAAILGGHEGKVRCLAYSPDGKWLATGGHDTTVRLWDVARCRARTP
jgi:WD40 repeat protein